MDIQVIRKTSKRYRISPFDESFGREEMVRPKIENREKIDFSLKPVKEKEEVFFASEKEENFLKDFFAFKNHRNGVLAKAGWGALMLLGLVSMNVYRANGSDSVATLGEENPTTVSASGISISGASPKISVSNHENRLADLEEKNTELIGKLKDIADQTKFFPVSNEKDVTQDEELAEQESMISELEEQLKAISDQNEAVIDFSLALDYKSLIYKDKAGNLDIPEGKVKAEEAIVEKMVIKNEEGKTMAGEGKIFPIKKDENLDGLDDETLSDGKSVVIKTEVVNDNSKIFITPKAVAAIKTPLTITEKQVGQYFKVEISESVSEEVGFDWWIIETK